jgi:putative DNA primase/helicase
MNGDFHDMGGAPPDWFAVTKHYWMYGEWDEERYGPVPLHPDTRVPREVRDKLGIEIDPDLAKPRKANGHAHKMDTGTKSPNVVEVPAQPNQPPKSEPSPPELEQPSSRENYNLDDLGIELRKVLNRVTASLVVAKRDSVKILKAVRAGAAALVEFDNDPGYDIAIAHLQAVARDHYTLSVDDIQLQISAGTQDALDRRARDQANSGSKRRRQRDRDVDPPPAAEPEVPTSEEAVWSSEDALALQFAGQYLDALRFVAPWSRWLRYNNDDGRWRTDERLETFDDARRICRAAALQANETKARMRLSSANTVAAVERLARSDQRLAASVDQWDRDPWLLNTPAGTVSLKTGATQGHRREDYITKIAATSPGGKCDLWRKFIETVTGGDTALADFIQRMLGYSLTGSTGEQCLFFLYGLGANGKSVLLNTVSSILADYHATAPIETFTASVTDRHPTDLAGLRGARLVTAIETEEGRRWAEAKIKSLTGGDPISARFMRQDFFTFTPQFKLIVAGNHKPSLRTVDEAIRRRFHLVPFTVTIPPAERDKDLPNKLKAEWPGILQWMIDGCVAWQRDGLNPPPTVREATAAYLEAEDAIAAWMTDCCARDPNAWSSSTALFGSWSAWATKTGESIGSQKVFSQKLENQAGVMKHSTNAGKGFYGLRIKLTYAD